MNCKQEFTGALQLQLARHMWRRHRDDSVNSRLLVDSCVLLGEVLVANDEEDAEKRLIGPVSTSSYSVVIHKLMVASIMAKERPEEALKFYEEVASQAKRHGDRAMLFLAQSQYICVTQHLGRYEESVAMATECLESTKTYLDTSSEGKYEVLSMFAFACGMTGRFDESRRAFDELLVSTTRVLGRDHEKTQWFLTHRAILLRRMVNKAQDLALRDDLANGARYLDAVFIESKVGAIF